PHPSRQSRRLCSHTSQNRLSAADRDDLRPGAAGYSVVLAAGYQGLSAADAVQYKLLPARVQLAEHIVEQQHGVLARLLQMYLPLSELYRERRGALLPLRGKGARA